MGRLISFSSATALVFLSLAPLVQAQEASIRKTLSLIPDDQAWGDVVENTQPCSVPGEASCSRFTASNKPLTPLQSFSAQSSPAISSNQNDPAKVSQLAQRPTKFELAIRTRGEWGCVRKTATGFPD